MIQKTIHFVWFGGNPYSDLTKRCIDSWRKYCPDFELRKWSEENFDINTCSYVKEAYKAKKWAFVSDYVRLYALVNEGGIYMDVDVEVVKSLDCFLTHEAFSGFENTTSVPTGIMGCQKGYPFFKELLNSYNDRHFILEDGSLDLTTNVVTITDACIRHGLRQDNSFQIVDGFALYPKSVFCPIEQQTGELKLSDDTVTIHHFSGSWVELETKQLSTLVQKLNRKFKNDKIKKILLYLLGFRWLLRLKIRTISGNRSRSRSKEN